MEDAGKVASDPRVLGLRLAEARKARGLTGPEAAQALALSRPTYAAVEKGERALSPAELVRLSVVLDRDVSHLLRPQEPMRDFARQFRSAAARAGSAPSQLDAAATHLQDLCEDYLYLEDLMAAPTTTAYPPINNLAGGDPVRVGEEMADAERHRLGLEVRPAPGLRSILETEVGIRVFCIGLPAGVSGLYLFNERAGACIAIQYRLPRGGALLSLAHQYAHFLTHRYEAEVTIDWEGHYKPQREQLTGSFARSFLMPRAELRRRFQQLKRARERVAMTDLVALADVYGVSVQAVLLRLEELKLVPVGTWNHLEAKGYRMREAQRLGNLASGTAESLLPQRYVKLALQAYVQEKLTEGELMRLLHTTRERARQTVASMRREDLWSTGRPAGNSSNLHRSPGPEGMSA